MVERQRPVLVEVFYQHRLPQALLSVCTGRGTPLTIDLASYIIDRFGGPLSYDVQANTNPSAVDTTALTQGNLQLMGVEVGSSSITIRVTNSRGLLNTDLTFTARAVTAYSGLVPPPVMSLNGTNRLADGSMLLSMTVVPGRNYQIEHSTNLTNWTQVPMQAGAESLQWIDRVPGDKKFYRLVDMTAP